MRSCGISAASHGCEARSTFNDSGKEKDIEGKAYSLRSVDVTSAVAPTLDELLTKTTAMALDLLPFPNVRPEQLLLHIKAIRQDIAGDGSDRAEWRDMIAAQAKSIEAV